MQPLTESELKTWLAANPDWQGTTDGIHCQWRFADFPSVITFMQAAVQKIEDLNHHPEWSNVYNSLSVNLRTHDAGNQVTALDTELATYLSTLFNG